MKRNSVLSKQTRGIVAGLICLAFSAACAPDAAPPPKDPGCRMFKIQIAPQVKSATRMAQAGAACDQQDEDTYHKLCDELVTQFEQRCARSCEKYKKRSIIPGEEDNPQLHRGECKRFPVDDAASSEYDVAKHCVVQPRKEPKDQRVDITVTCEVSATCTCDP